jgi:hypothetical protein
MTFFQIPCSEDQLKEIKDAAKKANKTFIKYVLDKLLEVEEKENKVIEKTFKKAIKEIRKDRDYFINEGKGVEAV